MTDLRDLYQELILDHSRQPRNFRVLLAADHRAEGVNPLCGDHYTVELKLDGEQIADVAFQGSGCAISKASASLMTAAVKGKPVAEARALREAFHRMVVGDGQVAPTAGKLAVFGGVREFPARVKCATLCWHALEAALDGAQDPVTTE